MTPRRRWRPWRRRRPRWTTSAPPSASVSTLPVWVDTVEALLAATADIAHAVQAGDAEALAEAQAAFEAAADDAARADQALTIALGEAAAGDHGTGIGRPRQQPAGRSGRPGPRWASLSILP